MNCTPKVRQYDILDKIGGVFMPTGKPFTGEFKQKVIEDMRENRLAYRETARKFGIPDHGIIRKWERIYLEEGPEGLFVERRGRANAESGKRKGRKPKLDKKVEEDLIAENQRLRAEIDYLKKLDALVTERVQREKKHK
jgi:transposase